MRTALKWMLSTLAILAFVAAGTHELYQFVVDPNAPKRGDLQLNQQIIDTPKRHVEPAVLADLQSALDEQGYKPGKAVTHNSEDSQRTYQIWTSPGKPKVELSDFGSGIYGLKTISFDSDLGDQKHFWCAPADKGASLEATINGGKLMARDIQDGIVTLSSNITMPSGTKFATSNDLNGNPLLTCYASNS